MTDQKQLEILKQGAAAWNTWRDAHPTIRQDLQGADLKGADLRGADLNGANLSKANLCEALLTSANLGAANFTKANLSKANLSNSMLVEANFTGADLTGCRIYGISAWQLKLNIETKQHNLVITAEHDPEVTVDNIEVAQLLDLLLHNEKIRDVIDTITTKVVLILGRFSYPAREILTLAPSARQSSTRARSR